MSGVGEVGMAGSVLRYGEKQLGKNTHLGRCIPRRHELYACRKWCMGVVTKQLPDEMKADVNAIEQMMSVIGLSSWGECGGGKCP